MYYMSTASVLNMRKAVECIVRQVKAQRRAGVSVHDNVATTDPWESYLKPAVGWFNCVCDMGNRIIEMGIKMDWPDITDDTQRPKWLRQTPFKPCSCNKCFFCKNNLTTLYGPPKIICSRKVANQHTTLPSSHQPSTSTRRTYNPYTSSTTRMFRGHPVSLVREHTRNPEVIIGYSRDCKICKDLGKTRKPKGVKLNDTNRHLYCKTSVKGCPHLDCQKPVCRDHWGLFRHNI